jgi:DNA-binding XRE family transcriptional regulator
MEVVAMPIIEAGNGASVRVARAVKDISQAKLAALTGISPSRIFQIERDLTRPSPEEWAKIWGVLTT